MLRCETIRSPRIALRTAPCAEPRWASAVLAKAVGLVDLGSRKGVRALARRSPQREEALGAEAPAGVARGEAALAQPELVVGAARHRVVALARIERPFDARAATRPARG